MKKLYLLLFTFHFSFFINCSAQIITTIAGNGTGGYSGNGGTATAAEIIPEGVAVDKIGNIYVSDADTIVRKINTSGIISTFAGNGVQGYSGDGGPATNAELNFPQGLASDGIGNIYIADWANDVIRKVNTAGIISTFAGNGFVVVGGSGGYSGNGGPATAAELDRPEYVAVDKLGNVYIADNRNNVVRKVDTSGIISTFAGNGYLAGQISGGGGFTGDGGPATAAELWGPGGVGVDNSGKVYIADFANHRVRIVDTSGIINTFAGDSIGGYSGDEGPATAAEISPSSVGVDDSGVYIAEYNDIRKVNTSGIISTFAGNDTNVGFSGDGGPATAAELSYITGVALDTYGNLYIADQWNNRIRKIWMVLSISANVITNVTCNGGINGTASVSASEGLVPYTYSWSNGATTSSVTNLSAGTYTVNVTDSLGTKGLTTVIITQPPAISISADSINATGSNCNGSVWAVVGGGTFPYSYLWSGGLTTDTITNQCAGNYCSIITDAHGCIDSVCVNIESVTGFQNNNYSPLIEIYPNPINSNFTVELSNPSGTYNFELYNILGEKISWTQLKTATTQINMSSDAKGIYLYRVLKEDGELIGEGKVVIEH